MNVEWMMRVLDVSALKAMRPFWRPFNADHEKQIWNHGEPSIGGFFADINYSCEEFSNRNDQSQCDTRGSTGGSSQ